MVQVTIAFVAQDGTVIVAVPCPKSIKLADESACVVDGFQKAYSVFPLKSFSPVTESSAIDCVSTVSAGSGAPFSRLVLVIFLVVEVLTSTIGNSSPLSGVVRLVSCEIFGILLSSLSSLSIYLYYTLVGFTEV